ncbi:protein NUCLEAR FUSION DEFECTIVE 4-like [Populus alba x Populus x berolinensis]|uniref:Protein NUCLEAR FUSION DEFECTIVE 4-like n=1 Tax=Populus alba x Populus x berolinensis TaxID=444605 RepID=A0AAD6RLF1_9ROSI|nr:protein NUCLEAR FUSION DEFECTIVE 4-like [Populus alba x Populus x berolinensis]
MAGQSRKWMILVATVWIQAFTGTNFDFSAYSSDLKSILGISQVQLNYLAVASDLGKVFGWSSGLALMYFPLWVVLFMAAFMGLFGYGLQWLVMRDIISLPYILVFLLCLLAGCSICWFNTVCFVLCIQNFPANRPLALSLTIAFNGVSAALYTLAGNAIDSSSNDIYLLLNAFIPLITSVVSLIPIIRQPSLDPLPPDGVRRDSLIFLILNFLAILTGIYLLLFGSSSSDGMRARLLLGGAIFLLIFPLCIPGIVYAREWFHRTIHSSFSLHGSGFILVDVDDLELHKELITRESSYHENGDETLYEIKRRKNSGEKEGCCDSMVKKDRLAMLGEEHPVSLLVSRKMYFARTAWLTIALVPTPIAFFLLAASGNAVALHISTALVGLSSGFIFAAAVSITSELFGPNSVGVNHNILITNIPIGSLVYGFLAAIVYDSHLLVILENQTCLLPVRSKTYFEHDTAVLRGCQDYGVVRFK